MVQVSFTHNLKRHLDCGSLHVIGDTVHEVLKQAFQLRPPLKHYIVDDAWRLRTHVAIFVDGSSISDRETLSDPVSPNSEIYIMQALSGG